MFSKFDKVKSICWRLHNMMNSILGNNILRVVIIVFSTCVTTLLVGGYFVYDRLTASVELVEKVDSLQLANKALVGKHEKDIANLSKEHMKDKIKIKAKARAKAKIQRGVAAIPIVGLAALAIFEKMEFDDWKKDHPDGTPEEYAREMYETSQELFNEEYRDFEEKYRDFEKYASQASESFEKYTEASQKLLEEKYRDLEKQAGQVSESSQELIKQKYRDLEKYYNSITKDSP